MSSMTKSFKVISFCFILSGATGLIYEVLWARMLGLVFGATTLAVSTVLAAFMGGLALGSALAGKLAARIQKPLSTYGAMEIGIAVYALLVPLLFRWVDHVYVLIWQQLHPGYFAFSLWRFLLSGLVLLVPTTLMGATLPVLAVAIVRSSASDSNSVTRLYACNLAGGILGTLVAGFVVLPVVGIRLRRAVGAGRCIPLTVAVAAVLEVFVCVIAVSLQRKTKLDAPGVTVARSIATTDHDKFWLFAALASGFVTISTQVSWTRILTMIIGSSTYAFSIVVALFLIGLAIGAWLVARTDRSQALRLTILKVEVLTAIGIVLSLFVLNKTPAVLVTIGLKFQIASWIGLLLLQIFCATLLILVPAVLMGMVMPLVLVWAGSSPARVGRTYAINTIGAIAGAFVTGFLLIPKTSTRFTLLFAATCCLAVACVAYRPAEPARDPALKRALAIGLIPFLMVLLFVVAPPMNLADLSIGAYDSLVRVLAKTREEYSDQTDPEQRQEAHELLMYREGPTAPVWGRGGR